MAIPAAKAKRLFPHAPPPSLETFAAICSQATNPKDYPLASSIQKNIPIYELPVFNRTNREHRERLQEEWHHALLEGPGVFVAKSLFPQDGLLDRVTAAFNDIVRRESQSNPSGGDHFAGAGKNDRIWDSFGKHGIADPESFVAYYSNPWLALICNSWLGPGYRITTQANNIKPGGQAQVCHRDYHFGFMSEERCLQFPRSVQIASQFLTLQGAVAHVDVPDESGPTRLLPFSQTFDPGYVAYRLPEFSDYFLKNYVTLPLKKGDGLFFNPALFHAGGANRSSNIDRMVNLFQVSSAMGKPMEYVNTMALIEKTWDILRRMYDVQGLSDEVQAFIGAVGEGYAFPTNLDVHQPRPGNMAPDSEQTVILEALEGHKDKEHLMRALVALKSGL